MGPDRFSYPPIPTDLPKPKPEVGIMDEAKKKIPLVEFKDVSNVDVKNETLDSFPNLKIPDFSNSFNKESQKTGEISLEGEKTPDELIAEVRSEYINSFSAWQGFKQKKPSKELSLMGKTNRKAGEETLSKSSADSYKKYQEIIKQIVKVELDKEINESMKDWTVEQTTERIANKQAELIEKYIIKESAYLEEKKIENWPPKEKGWWKTTLESYSKQPRLVKLAMSTAVGTAVAVSMPGIMVGGTVGLTAIAGLRLARGLGGSFVGLVVSKLVAGFLGKNLEKESKKEQEKIISSVDSFEEVQKQYQEFLIKRDKLKTRNKWLTMAAGVVSGVGFSAGSSVLENSVSNILGLKHTIPTSGKTISSEPTKPDLGETHPIPEAELNYESSSAPKVEVQTEAMVSGSTLKPGGVTSSAETTTNLPIEVGDEDLTAQIERLTVRPKEGFWQPISREVEFRIKADPGKYGLSTKDIETDSSELAKAVTRETNRILRDNGYLDANSEIWIDKSGSVITLSEDGKLGIEGSELSSHNFADNQVSTTSHPVAKLEDKLILKTHHSSPSRNLTENLTNHTISELENKLTPIDIKNFTENQTGLEVSISGEAAGPWLTDGLKAHENWEPLAQRLNDLDGQIDENFLEKLETASLSELEKQSNLFGETGTIPTEILKLNQLTELLKKDGLEVPLEYQEAIENLNEKLEKIAEIKAARLEQFEEFQKSLPANYNSNSQWTVKNFLEREASVYKIPGQSNGDALEIFVNSCNPSAVELNMTLKQFFASRLNDSGFHNSPINYEHSEIIPHTPVSRISEAMQVHAQINVIRAEVPDYMENLDLSLEVSKKMSLEDFNKNFINNPEFNSIKTELAEICRKTTESIKFLEDAGWKVNPEIKDSISGVVKKVQELDALTDKYLENWKEFLDDVGLDEKSYVSDILNAKDDAKNPLSTGTILEIARHKTPSEIGKFGDFVYKVREFSKGLSPEELAEARKLPVDQFIKQNIKL